MEKPILFSTEMIQAILRKKNPKTQTRRIINPQPNIDNDSGYVFLKNGKIQLDIYNWKEDSLKFCPFGKVGDILWVRETWGIRVGMIKRNGAEFDSQDIYLYKANWNHIHKLKGWKPSIHMPKEVCRIKLRNTDLRVERLQDITTEDILKEGFKTNLREYDAEVDLKSSFKDLWNKLNSKRGYSWNSNPYVWVISFERI